MSHVSRRVSFTNIRAIQCVGPAERCLPRCTVTVKAQSGVTLRFSGADFAPSTRIAFTAVGDCQERVLEAPLLPDSRVEFVMARPGMLQVCYCTNYDSVSEPTWVLQSRHAVHVTVETVWHDAALVGEGMSVRLQKAGGGESITVLGSGFSSSQHYTCHLSVSDFGASSGSSAASVKSVDKVTCDMPSFHHPSTVAFFSVRLGDGSVMHHTRSAVRILVVPQVAQVTPKCGDKLGGDVLSVRGFGFGGPAAWSFNDSKSDSNQVLPPIPACTGPCNASCVERFCSHLLPQCQAEKLEFEWRTCVLSHCTNTNASVSNASRYT
jgi:hypothetical protein